MTNPNCKHQMVTYRGAVNIRRCMTCQATAEQLEIERLKKQIMELLSENVMAHSVILSLEAKLKAFEK